MIEVNNEVFIIDTGPDFRQQMLSNNVNNISGVFFTHHHKDHVAFRNFREVVIKPSNTNEVSAILRYCNDRLIQNLTLAYDMMNTHLHDCHYTAYDNSYIYYQNIQQMIYEQIYEDYDM